MMHLENCGVKIWGNVFWYGASSSSSSITLHSLYLLIVTAISWLSPLVLVLCSLLPRYNKTFHLQRPCTETLVGGSSEGEVGDLRGPRASEIRTMPSGLSLLPPKCRDWIPLTHPSCCWICGLSWITLEWAKWQKDPVITGFKLAAHQPSSVGRLAWEW